MLLISRHTELEIPWLYLHFPISALANISSCISYISKWYSKLQPTPTALREAMGCLCSKGAQESDRETEICGSDPECSSEVLRLARQYEEMEAAAHSTPPLREHVSPVYGIRTSRLIQQYEPNHFRLMWTRYLILGGNRIGKGVRQVVPVELASKYTSKTDCFLHLWDDCIHGIWFQGFYVFSNWAEFSAGLPKELDSIGVAISHILLKDI